MKTLFALSLVSVAASANLYQSCPGYDESDPYTVNARFDVGPNAGLCMDTSFRRAVDLLAEGDALAYGGRPSEEWVISNFYHEGRFWVARIPKNGVKDVIFQVEHFSTGSQVGDVVNEVVLISGHGQVRFDMKDGQEVVLVPQRPEDRSKLSNVRLASFVVSGEAIQKPNDHFGLVSGLKNDFAIGKRFVSLSSKAKDMVVDQGHRVDQYRIKPHRDAAKRDARRQEFLAAAVQQSVRQAQAIRANNPEMYNTAFEMCFTEAFDIFDKVTEYLPIQRRLVWKKRVPALMGYYLFQRGLLYLPYEPEAKIPSLNEEMGVPVRD